ncbi:MAG: hypothetical protein IPG04_15310 [Polyangiaceae bacterium]|nr:hypothetical protein [Polyangiaceae bacterium]
MTKPRSSLALRVSAHVACASVLALPSMASAAPLRVDKVDKAPSLDGSRRSGRARTVKLGAVKGAPSATDFAVKGAVTYDDKNVYVAVDVADDKLVGGDGDRVDLVLAIRLFGPDRPDLPGQPGKSAGRATSKGSAVTGAKVVEAPTKSGWTLEASIPWAALDGTLFRVGSTSRGLFAHDVDGTGIEATVGSSSTPTQSALEPAVDDAAGADGRHLRDKARHANFAGPQRDRRLDEGAVLVFGSHLLVLGPTFRSGKEYWFSDMAVSGSSMTILSTELRDLDGDSKDDIVFKKRFTKSGSKTSRDVLQVYSFGASASRHHLPPRDRPVEREGERHERLELPIERRGKPTIVIKPGTAKGLRRQDPRRADRVIVRSPLGPPGAPSSRRPTRRAASRSRAPREPPPGGRGPLPRARRRRELPLPRCAPEARRREDLARPIRGTAASRGRRGSDPERDVADDAQVSAWCCERSGDRGVRARVQGRLAYVFTGLSFASGADIRP